MTLSSQMTQNLKTVNVFFINATKKSKLKPFSNSSNTDKTQITSVFKGRYMEDSREYLQNIRVNDFNFRQVSLMEVKS